MAVFFYRVGNGRILGEFLPQFFFHPSEGVGQ